MTIQSLPKLVLLDRDGVINVDRPDSVKSIAEFEFIPGVGKAIHKLNESNISVAIVTNQAVVGRGGMTEKTLNDLHSWMEEMLKTEGAHIDQIYTCTSPDPTHPDRKPNPGLLVKALNDFDVPPTDTLMIGDAGRDLEAAHAAGCEFYLVLTGKGEKTREEGLPDGAQPVTICTDLMNAVDTILKP